MIHFSTCLFSINVCCSGKLINNVGLSGDSRYSTVRYQIVIFLAMYMFSLKLVCVVFIFFIYDVIDIV